MAKVVVKRGKHECWVNDEGLEVPVAYIPKHDKERDALVEDIFQKIIELNNQMAKTKEMIRTKVSKHLDTVAENYGEKWKGNALLTNFDKTRQLEVKVSQVLTFDERLQIAKTKIDNYIRSLVSGQGKELVALVNNAFRLDKKGNISVAQVLSLRQVQIDHPDWREAMSIIDESITVNSTKLYYNFRIKGEDGAYEPVSLNFSAM